MSQQTHAADETEIQEGIEALEELLRTTEGSYAKFRNAYFRSPPGNASSRRSYEEKHSWASQVWIQHETARTNRRYLVEVSFQVSCSCRNIYIDKSIWINGKGTNLTGLRGFVKSIREGEPIAPSRIPPSHPDFTA